jgi:hypothetical protein
MSKMMDLKKTSECADAQLTAPEVARSLRAALRPLGVSRMRELSLAATNKPRARSLFNARQVLALARL